MRGVDSSLLQFVMSHRPLIDLWLCYITLQTYKWSNDNRKVRVRVFVLGLPIKIHCVT